MYQVLLFLTVSVEEFLRTLVRFPLSWYGTGFSRLLQWMMQQLRYQARGYALTLWARSLFVPMYGSYDIWGRIISFFARIIVLIVRVCLLGVTALVYVAGAIIYVIAPLGVVIGFLLSLSSFLGIYGITR